MPIGNMPTGDMSIGNMPTWDVSGISAVNVSDVNISDTLDGYCQGLLHGGKVAPAARLTGQNVRGPSQLKLERWSSS